MIRDTALATYSRHRQWLGIIGVVLAVVFYTARVQNNPPGFYLDESSIAYNAYSISETGRDEHGTSWPLFFRAFGEYKNPVYIYLLAGLFKLTGPSILVARLLSVASGVLAAFVLGVLAARITGRHAVGILVGINSLFTSWLFEMSRFVMEVAIFPLTLALFLLCLHRLSAKAKWSHPDAISLALTLALITYTYSIGRLLAPLLAAGLALFVTRERWPSVLKTWCAYFVTLIPLIVFNRQYPGALTHRFKVITYLSAEASYGDTILQFARHYIGHLNPFRLLLIGKANPDLFVNGHMLIATFIFALIGGYLMLRSSRREPWWRFIFYGLLVSIVPAALTREYFHLLRLAAVPIFLIVLSAPGIAWLLKMAQLRRTWQTAFAISLALTLLQAIFLQWQFHAIAKTPERLHQFDADYTQTILAPAIASSSTPIYLADGQAPGYIHAYWYGTLQGIDLSRFVRLAPSEAYPQGAMVISTEQRCYRCSVIAWSEPYALYLARDSPRRPAPLGNAGFRAELYSPAPPASLRAGIVETIRVKVKNTSELIWLAPERRGGQYLVSLGNHWLDVHGQVVVGDDGRCVLMEDVGPGEEIELPLTINTPPKTGKYILEIDMLQEGVAWFGHKGSRTLRLPVNIE